MARRNSPRCLEMTDGSVLSVPFKQRGRKFRPLHSPNRSPRFSKPSRSRLTSSGGASVVDANGANGGDASPSDDDVSPNDDDDGDSPTGPVRAEVRSPHPR